MTIRRFRKAPVEVDAIQFQGYNAQEVADFLGSDADLEGFREELTVSTLEGDIVAAVGDWVIRGIAGEVYPCKPGLFHQYCELDDGPVAND